MQRSIILPNDYGVQLAYSSIILFILDTEITTAVSWSPDCQLLSCSDDKIVGKWGADGESIGKITTLNVFISSLSWFPASGKQVNTTSCRSSIIDSIVIFFE
jgi:hypothetical protein